MFRSTKYRDIVEDPVIRYKPVETLPGIGPVHGRRLRDNGFYTADQVLAQYLALKRNEQRFVSWMSMAGGVSAHWAAQCFSGLNEWYNTWGRDVKLSKKSPSPSLPPERGSITNRMLLEQKMLQFNSNSSDDRLRSLFSNQTVSLVDISKSSTERPSFALSRLNKSNFNIAENTHAYTEQDKTNNYKKLPSPTPKSVNFKENVEYNAQLPKKTPPSVSSKRPISPILKSRSLTPDLSQKSKKLLNLPIEKTETKSKGSSMNNLNLTGRVNKRQSLRAKSIENISGSNTFTKNKSKTSTCKKFNLKPEKLVCTCDYPYQELEIWNSAGTFTRIATKTSASKKLNLEKPEVLVCTCNYPYGEVELGNLSETDGRNAPQNIKKHFVEKQNNVKNFNFVTSVCSTPLKPNQSKTNYKSQSQTRDSPDTVTKSNCWNDKTSRIENKSNVEKSGKQDVAIERHNLNEDDDSVISSEYVLTGNEETHEDNEHSFTVDSRELENVQLKTNKKEVDSVEVVEEVNFFQTNVSEVNEIITSEKTMTQTFYEGSYCDNSNEDSGLDVTPKKGGDCQEFAAESQTTDDECSTPFENLDSHSQSETDTETDRTFEVNDTTDAESGFHFVSTNSNSALKRTGENELTKFKVVTENETEQSIDSQLDDELKRSNIRLFCDMLSNDFEQLPMEKFRKLKLKILQLVYEEIDRSAEK